MSDSLYCLMYEFYVNNPVKFQTISESVRVKFFIRYYMEG